MNENLNYGIMRISCDINGNPLQFVEMMSWENNYDLNYMQAVIRCTRIGRDQGKFPLHRCLNWFQAIKYLPWLSWMESFVSRRGTQVVICRAVGKVDIYCPVQRRDI